MEKEKTMCIKKWPDKVATELVSNVPINASEKYFLHDNCMYYLLQNDIRMLYFDDDEAKPNIYLKTKEGVKAITSKCVFYKPQTDMSALGIMGILTEKTVPIEDEDKMYLSVLLHPLVQMKLYRQYQKQEELAKRRVIKSMGKGWEDYDFEYERRKARSRERECD